MIVPGTLAYLIAGSRQLATALHRPDPRRPDLSGFPSTGRFALAIARSMGTAAGRGGPRISVADTPDRRHEAAVMDGGKSRRFDAVLFDLDGTLIDSTELIVESYRHTLREVAGTEPSYTEVVSGFGTPLVDNLHRLSPEPALVPRMIEVYSEYNAQRHDDMIRPFPDAIEAAWSLKNKGFALAVVTGKRRAFALRGLRFVGLDTAFEVVVTPESTELPKPHPDPVRKALRQLAVQPERAVMVGDSPHDIVAARSAGVAAAAALWGPGCRDALASAQPTFWLEDAATLLHAVV